MNKDQKKNIILMGLLALILIICIATRYKFIKEDIKKSIDVYLEPFNK